ncbi:RAS oncogene family member Rab35 isoform X3 [Ptiloglossa arizonensis]|uniref:RAS oncogene family member Rab35 isoform X3 n=1 Tax=Ptiloglossa arizonensis TaxID=3350558 RepID=UPI003FA0EAFB
MAREYDHLFKLLIIGDSGVGKSSLLLRFADNTFNGSYITTIGVDFKIQTVEIDVVYDVTSGDSFANVKRWLHEIEQNCDVVNRVLVGNKNDAPNEKVVLTEDAQRFANQMGIQLFETSAKDNINVQEMFMAITRQVLRTKKERKERQAIQTSETVNLRKSTKQHKKKCC